MPVTRRLGGLGNPELRRGGPLPTNRGDSREPSPGFLLQHSLPLPQPHPECRVTLTPGSGPWAWRGLEVMKEEAHPPTQQGAGHSAPSLPGQATPALRAGSRHLRLSQQT